MTQLKQLALSALYPLLPSLLSAQHRFNQEALALARGLAAGMAARASCEELAQRIPGGGALFARQARWNRLALQALQAAASTQPGGAILAELERLDAGPPPGALALLGKLAAPLLEEVQRPQLEFNRSFRQALHTLLGLHRTDTFAYGGYQIPRHLLELTGSHAESWEAIGLHHLRDYQRLTPIAPAHHVLEIGCGVGRDAMQLARLLSAEGRYTGIDITPPSIAWCKRHISARHPRFEFIHLDIKSELYNPTGVMESEDARLPVEAASVDRILLQSVFTHLFPKAVKQYLREFRRVMRPGAMVFASLFVLDAESDALSRGRERGLRFPHRRQDRSWIASLLSPEEAVAYLPGDFELLLVDAGLKLHSPVIHGSWSGRAADGYQDIAILIAA